MSNRNNDVFAVLVTSGNQAVLAAGNPVSALAVGQVGVFDHNSGLSISAATSPMPREIFMAVGVDKTGSGTLEDLRTSAGQLIQKNGITGYSFKAHSAGRPEIQLVSGYGAKCDTDYAVSIELRNSRIYKIQGFNGFKDTYAVRTGCCDDCTDDCNSYDANKLTVAMVAEINLGGRAIATAVARTALDSAVVTTLSGDYTAGQAISQADIDALIAYNATQTDPADRFYTDFTIQSKPIAIPVYNQVNLGFHKFLHTKMHISLVDGFACGGSVTTTQALAYEEGSGTNIQDKEYHASAWSGAGPYVLSETTGTPKGNIEFLASASGKYDQFILEYFQKSESGWGEYENVLSTIVAIPEASTTTRNGLATVLDAYVAGNGFEPLADDAAAASTTATVVEAQPASKAVDGLA